MKKLLDSVKIHLKHPIQNAKTVWHQSSNGLEDHIEDLKEILDWLQNKSIQIKPNEGCKDNIANQIISCDDTQKDSRKKRGRPRATAVSETSERHTSSNSDTASLNDSVSSTSSSRSRRAAAQAAEQRLAVQSLNQLKTKLRRPTDFDEKQNNAGSSITSPPAKSRRTPTNQSAGVISPNIEKLNYGTQEEIDKNTLVIENETEINSCKNTDCVVLMNKLNTPTIVSYTQVRDRPSRSLDHTCKRKSEDLFDDSIPLSELNSKQTVQEARNSDPSHKSKKKKSVSKKDLDSGFSSTEELLMKSNVPFAHSSPILQGSPVEDFRGFGEEPKNTKTEKQHLIREHTFLIGVKSENTEIIRKENIKCDSEESSTEEVELIEAQVVKSKHKVIKKGEAQSVISLNEKENFSGNNETHVISSKLDDSPALRSRTKVLRKATEPVTKSEVNDGKQPEGESHSQISPENKTRRSKTISKHREDQHQELNSEKEQSSPEVETSNMRSRTKTIKKAINTNGLDSQCLASGIKDKPLTNNIILPSSPAPVKGELVKKRVEDFEKMQNGVEEIEEEKSVGRVTRNAMKNKVASSATDSKQTRAMVQLPASSLKKTLRKSLDKWKQDKDKENVPVSKVQGSSAKLPLSVERSKLTPLGVNNRMTPFSDPKIQVNKWTNLANHHQTQVENNNVALISKQVSNEAERKKKEERLKRQVKEEDAKKKKEKTLKATADETRRKREEKLQKVAAAREAAEKEKERLAAKAEKEKEEKMRQIAAEKEKQKEELLKKKQMMQQKTLEHEERRKHEEAARLAKLKEQEEEHKRLVAMKEREQEMQKQQKAELRLVEAEKTKAQGGKLGKIAIANSAKLKIQGTTPSNKTNVPQPSESYEITPAREDRPPLQPKSENDYGIDDANSEDSSDDESQPKKMIPAWAQSKNRERLLLINKYIPKDLWVKFMECNPNPDINKIFAGNLIKKRIRTSSAIWASPPKYSRIAN